MAQASRSNSMQYNGGITAVGNSKVIGLDDAFFKAHPEFDGEVVATVLADGQVLLSAKSKVRHASNAHDVDPVMLGFLQYLEKQMTEQPDLVEPLNRTRLERIGKLVEGVSSAEGRSTNPTQALLAESRKP
ncbi:MAG: hypothetical protein Q7U14_16480 [Lacisediminimonas sp.]|nr:hypothetical protein [Lacisediminimonas sp.]